MKLRNQRLCTDHMPLLGTTRHELLVTMATRVFRMAGSVTPQIEELSDYGGNRLQ